MQNFFQQWSLEHRNIKTVIETNVLAGTGWYPIVSSPLFISKKHLSLNTSTVRRQKFSQCQQCIIWKCILENKTEQRLLRTFWCKGCVKQPPGKCSTTDGIDRHQLRSPKSVPDMTLKFRMFIIPNHDYGPRILYWFSPSISWTMVSYQKFNL